MAIQSASEFEAMTTQVILRLEKEIVVRGTAVPLERARDEFKRLFESARQSAKLKAMRKKLEEMTDVISAEIPNDSALLDKLWDLADYIDYRA